jgi:hypothetical protein
MNTSVDSKFQTFANIVQSIAMAYMGECKLTGDNWEKMTSQLKTEFNKRTA